MAAAAKKDKRRENALKVELSGLMAVIANMETRMKQVQRPDTLEELVADVNALTKPLQRIRALQDPATAPLTAEEKAARGERFTKWLCDNAPGCHVGENCKFVWDAKEGAAVVALKDLRSGEEFISIPRKVMMTSQTALESRLGPILKTDPIAQTMPNLVLALHLAFEDLNKDSFWRPYLDVLPRLHELSLPLFFSLDELSLLRGSSTYYHALKLHKSTIRQYAHFNRQFKRAGHLELPYLTYDQFAWAVGVSMSRQNRIPTSRADTESSIIALIPGWDMCNFAAGKMTTYFNVETDTSESATMAAVRAGEQIRIFYGDRPNGKLFLFQGFVVSPHPNDTLDFVVHMAHPTVTNPKLAKLMLSKRALQPEETFTLLPDGAIPRRLVDYCRMVTATNADAAFALKNPDAEVLSAANEVNALTFLVARLEEAAAAYPTTAEQDRAALVAAEAQPPSPAARHAVVALQCMIAEKSVVEGVLRAARERLAAAQANAGESAAASAAGAGESKATA